MMPVFIPIRGFNVDFNLAGQVLTINDKLGLAKVRPLATVRLARF